MPTRESVVVNFGSIAGMVAVLLCGFFFWQQRENERLVQRVIATSTAVAPPILVGGAELRLEYGTRAVETWPEDFTPSNAGRALLLAFSSSCPGCQEQLPTWLQAVPDLDLGEQDYVLILAFSESLNDLEPLISRLRSANRAYRLLETVDNNVVARTSGIIYTPLIAVLDPVQRVLAIVQDLGTANQRVLATVLERNAAPQMSREGGGAEPEQLRQNR